MISFRKINHNCIHEKRKDNRREWRKRIIQTKITRKRLSPTNKVGSLYPTMKKCVKKFVTSWKHLNRNSVLSACRHWLKYHDILSKCRVSVHLGTIYRREISVLRQIVNLSWISPIFFGIYRHFINLSPISHDTLERSTRVNAVNTPVRLNFKNSFKFPWLQPRFGWQWANY